MGLLGEFLKRQAESWEYIFVLPSSFLKYSVMALLEYKMALRMKATC